MYFNVVDYAERILSKVNIELNNQQKLLDVGCGDGGDAQLFSENTEEVVGIDIAPHSNWLRTKRNNVNFLIADGCNLPFPDNIFDIVFEKDVLHHIQNHKEALGEIMRVTKVGGKVIIVEANRYNPISYIYMVHVHKIA